MQSRETGAAANELGHLAAKLVGDAIGAIKVSETSNEFDCQGNRVAIKIARAGTTSVGVTYGMLSRLHSVIGAFENSAGEFSLYSLPAEAFQSHAKDSKTGNGEVGLVTKKVFQELGTPMQNVRIDLRDLSEMPAPSNPSDTEPSPAERDRIWDEFLKVWPAERVTSMTLEQYIAIKDTTTFAWWLESGTERLGSIWGGSAFKFGIFQVDPSRKERAFEAHKMYKTDGIYAWYAKYGNARDEAFNTTKQRILAVIEAARAGKLESIGPIQLGRAVKWKIASLYQDRNELPITPIFDKKGLNYLAGIPGKKASMAELMRKLYQTRGEASYWDFARSGWEKWNTFRKQNEKPNGDSKKESVRHWLYAPGRGGERWGEFFSEGVMAIGWDDLGNLKDYATKEQVAKTLQRIDDDAESSKRNDATGCWSFAHDIKPGDVVFAKIGRTRIIGRGVVKSDYRFEPDRDDFRHVREVDWQARGEWTVTDENRFALKTLTDVTRFPDFVDYLLNLTGAQTVREASLEEDESEEEILMTRPKNLILYGPPGTGKTYALQQEYIPQYKAPIAKPEEPKPIKFEDFTWFEVIAASLSLAGTKAKVADIFNHPLFQAKVLSSGRTVNLRAQIWSTLQTHASLDSKHVNYNGRQEPHVFDKDTDSTWTLLPNWRDEAPEAADLADRWKKMTAGPSGLPPASSQEDRYTFITFHPSYSYEDFIEGIRPVMEDEGEDLRYGVQPGIFRKICTRAKADPANRYALFIDEINRGNIAKIFGELITLIEEDKRCEYDPDGKCIRGTEITLPYSGDRFGVPRNLDIYGTMNTADRSIALLDVALRRRFRFQEVPPEPEAIDGIDRSGNVPDGEGGSIDLQSLLTALNNRLLLLRDRDHLLGHSFFIKCANIEDVREAIRDNILPLLQEYFYDDYRRIKQVFADPAAGEEVFIEARKLDARILLGSEDESLEERYAYQVTPSEDWTPDMLRRIYTKPA